MKTKLVSILVIFFSFTSLALFSEPTETEIDSRAVLAMSNPEYRVTAGDVYVLGYAAGTTAVKYELIVDSTYKLRVSNLASIDVEGKTFVEVKSQVEQIVSKNYPLSGVQFVLKSPAIFTVTLKGEVSATAEPQTWAMQRLSSLVKPYVTSYSSVRDITVTSRSGKSKVYDLFKAQRFGDLSQDPYLRPGDIIYVGKLSRSVTISGAVERPGTYQLLAGEGLKELVELYGAGLTPKADSSRIELVRVVNSQYSSGEKFFFSKVNITNNEALQNYDSVTIFQLSDLAPFVFIEGAIQTPQSTTPGITNKMSVQYEQGENYASLVRRYRTLFTSVSDLPNAYIIRDSKTLALNLNPMLFDVAYVSDYFVEANDTLVIPFRQFYVTVSGAVRIPGRYPYIPDRDWSYYVALAGGFNKLENSGKTITITDLVGKKYKKTDRIVPEMNINAASNSFIYYFNVYSPMITTTLAIITSYFTVSALMSAR